MSSFTVPELRKLAETDIIIELTPAQYGPVLSSPPFINVQGTFNVRDIGLVPRETSTASKVRPGFAFRSGALQHLTDKGKATLAQDLGVRRVFDLRSQDEHSKGPDPAVAEGVVTMVWDAAAAEETPHVSLAPFVEGQGEKGYAAMYLSVLQAYRSTIKQMLEHVRDRPSEPFLFHCTAGRDRTGVVAGLLHTLAGESSDVILLDYLLTRIGSEPMRAQLEAFARDGSGLFKDAGSSESASLASAAKAAPGFLNLINQREVCWNAFLEALDKEYGGYEGYAKTALGFSDADIATIKKNLTTA